MITRTVDKLEREIDALIADGYRLDMIMPADAPREALLSKREERIRLSRNPQSEIRIPKSTGRAGMEYRDLIPDRLGGRLIASHIRINEGGPVPDYVHYHKISFQMIYCKSGWVRVVYEDQGPPFVLEAGDCVLQPPEIRHRVLEASAGAEVIELGSPAEHETWIDYDIDLPTKFVNPGRSFGGQTFVRHVAANSEWQYADDEFKFCDLGIYAGTRGMVDAKVTRTAGVRSLNLLGCDPMFLFVLDGSLKTTNERGDRNELSPDESILIPAYEQFAFEASAGAQYLSVSMLAL